MDLQLGTDRKQIPQLYSSKVVSLNDIVHMSPGEIAAFHLKVKDDLLYVDSKGLTMLSIRDLHGTGWRETTFVSLKGR